MFSLDIDPYEVLGVRPNADEVEIRRARRELVLKYPNELFPERAQEINKAFQLLTSKEKRRLVDAFLMSRAGSALRVQKDYLSEEVKDALFDYPNRSEVFELFKLEEPVDVDRDVLIESLLTVLEK
ncbi:MAG: J domain-containing protein [Candidatus Coatesbacteria bacterium]|nr:J domain-containing protein [Candidatus Coatesbacteria bacterium]